jgi:hypothetical protein
VFYDYKRVAKAFTKKLIQLKIIDENFMAEDDEPYHNTPKRVADMSEADSKLKIRLLSFIQKRQKARVADLNLQRS